MRESSSIWLIGALAVALSGATCTPRNTARDLSLGGTSRTALPPAGEVRSNMLRGDYAGSDACKGCHADLYASWIASPMHNMTRLVTKARVQAPFDGRVFAFQGDRARLESRGDERFVVLESAHYGNKACRVTKVIGGHYREDFVGIEVRGVSQDAAPVDAAVAEELVLPVSYVIGTQSFRYKGYSVLLKERDGLRAGPVWKKTCMRSMGTSPRTHCWPRCASVSHTSRRWRSTRSGRRATARTCH